MKKIMRLFRKELNLNIYPALYLFLLLNILLLIPSYPYTVVLVFSFVPIQIYMQSCLSNNETGFTAILPVSRRDIVVSKHLAIYYLQTMHLLVSVPFALISAFVINKGGNIVGTDANLTLYAIAFIALGCMNVFMLSGYFKTGCKIGVPFVGGLIILAAVLLVCELSIALIPDLKSTLDGRDSAAIGYRLIVFIVGLAIYAASYFISVRISVKNFERVNM